jgi:hypothetical protein
MSLHLHLAATWRVVGCEFAKPEFPLVVHLSERIVWCRIKAEAKEPPSDRSTVVQDTIHPTP